MNLPRLDRLRAMSPAEIQFRAAATLRREANRLSWVARPPAWRRQAIGRVLTQDTPLARAVAPSVKHAEWMEAHDALRRHFASRAPRFVLDPRSRASLPALVREQFPEATKAAIGRAGAVVADRFNLLGYRNLAFGGDATHAEIDWHADPVHGRRAPQRFWADVPYLDPAIGDHKIIWELNRHQFWPLLGRAWWLTGDQRYRDTFVRQFNSWMAQNPPLVGVNWASMLELGFRAISWLWALHFFVSDADEDRSGASPWTIDLLIALDRQLSHVERNLSRYFSPNTHLLGEALALYVVGRTLPELARSAQWERLGRAVLLEEIPRQIGRDGGHAELSAHYHHYTLDFYLLALAVARRTDDAAAPAFAEASHRLARFARVLADDDGRLPALGDDDGGAMLPWCGRDPSDAADSLQLAARLLDDATLAVGAPAEEVIWMTGEPPAAPPANTAWPSTALSDAGLMVSRTTRGDRLTVDAGPHGFLNGGHAHADALSITLSVRGLPLLIDPGTGSYTSDPELRDRLRSTALHNTMTVDDRSQALPEGPFHWRTRANGAALAWHADPAGGFDFFEGVHDGYAPLVHHRMVLARPGCWLIVDRLLGAGAHDARVHWHLDRAWKPRQNAPGVVRADHPTSGTVWILSDAECAIVRGSNGTELGWCAPVYGRLVPTATITPARRADGPIEIVTAIIDAVDEPALERLPVFDQAGSVAADGFDACGLRVTTRSWVDTVLWRPGRDRHPAVWTAGNLETDARLLGWRESAEGDAGVLAQVGGSIARPIQPMRTALRVLA